MRLRWILLAPFAIAAFVLFIALGGEIVHRLWNWLLPPLFGWRLITFWQALGLLALCRILFGGFGLSPRSRPYRTRDERQRDWQRMRERWGFARPAGSPGTEL